MRALLTASFLLGLAGISNAAPLVLNFAPVVGSNVTFNGDGTFGFTNSGNYDFQITSSTGGAGSAVSLLGNIDAPAATPESSSSAFHIGTISTSGIAEVAPVTGSTALIIADGAGHNLTGTLAFVDIFSIGTTGGTNEFAQVNLTGLTYTGTNTDLLTLAQNGNGIVTATYQFGFAESLDELVSTKVSSSYSGSITATPEPGWYALPLLGMNLGLFFMLRRRKTAEQAK